MSITNGHNANVIAEKRRVIEAMYNDCIRGKQKYQIMEKFVNGKYDIMSLGDIMQNRLKALRKSRGYTQVSLQMQTGIEQALLSKFENGDRIKITVEKYERRTQ